MAKQWTASSVLYGADGVAKMAVAAYSDEDPHVRGQVSLTADITADGYSGTDGPTILGLVFDKYDQAEIDAAEAAFEEGVSITFRQDGVQVRSL